MLSTCNISCGVNFVILNNQWLISSVRINFMNKLHVLFIIVLFAFIQPVLAQLPMRPCNCNVVENLHMQDSVIILKDVKRHIDASGYWVTVNNRSNTDTFYCSDLFLNADRVNDMNGKRDNFIYMKLFKRKGKAYTQQIKGNQFIAGATQAIVLPPKGHYTVGCHLAAFFNFKHRGKYKLQCYYLTNCDHTDLMVLAKEFYFKVK